MHIAFVSRETLVGIRQIIDPVRVAVILTRGVRRKTHHGVIDRNRVALVGLQQRRRDVREVFRHHTQYGATVGLTRWAWLREGIAVRRSRAAQ